ncbi:MAG: GGDEF domain-containing protein [Lachnospiraceae bacterium]|nr:GGDEF domain-containing protein [Lachnospiraceae bacterium]
MNRQNSKKKRPRIGIMVGNYHSDHPRRLVRLIWELLSGRDVEARFYLGTESSSFLSDIDAQGNKFDYQYSSFYNLSRFDDLDLLIVSIGTLSIYQSHITVDEFLSRMPDIPIVLMDNDTELKNGAWLIADNYNGVVSCVEHLILEHGLRKLVFLGGPLGNRDGEERLKAYMDTMERHGLEVTRDMIEHGDYSEHVDREVERLLDRNPDAEGIVSANDEMAVAIYRVCRNRGLTPGRDIAVTGFDDTEVAKYMDPPLTTVKQDYDLLSKKAVDMAFEILDGGKAESERVPSPMILRASCGCDMEYTGKWDENDELERDELIRNMWYFLDSRHESWIGSLLMREMLLETADRERFLEKLGKSLSFLKAEKSYVYLFDEPRRVKSGENPGLPDDLRLVMVQNGNECKVYSREEAPLLNAGKGSGIPDSIPEGCYMTFFLFYEEYQYGTLNLEISPERTEFFYMFSLETGLSLRYLQMSMQQARYHAELQALARHDNLTGLYNRLGLIGAVSGYFRQHKNHEFVAMMADLDHLKQINDTFGHKEGDSAITKAAEILREAIGAVAPLGRTGGDEYMGIFVNGIDRDAETVKNFVKKKCEEYNSISGKPYYLEISTGFHHFRAEEYTELSSVMEKADAGLYEAKKLRRASVVRDQEAQ